MILWKNNPLLRLSLCLLGGMLCTGIVIGGLLLVPVVMPARANPTAQHCVQFGDVIQDVINAADSGDVIALETDIFTETLLITKSLTLSGGWEDGCSRQPLTDTTLITADYAGRVIKIEPDDPNDEIEVSLENINLIRGDASGLGGANQQDPPGFAELEDWRDERVFTPTVSQAPVDEAAWKEVFQLLLAQDLLPGGSQAYSAYGERMKSLQQSEWRLVEQLPSTALADSVPMAPHGDEVDCGGGIYANHASLDLHNVSVMLSRASTTGEGYGGGLCVVNLPENGEIRIGDLILFKDNYASVNHEGIGGAVYINGGDEVNVTTTPVVIEEGALFWRNAASNAQRGYGGNLAVYNAGALSIDAGIFSWGLAGRSNDLSDYDAGTSYGGGIFLQNCPDASIMGTIVTNNMADSGGVTGFGGGVAILNSNNVKIGDGALFGRNTAQAQLGLYGADGLGGGIALLGSQNVHVDDVLMEFNLGSLYSQGYGGAIFSFGADHLVVENSRFFDNMAAVYPNGNLYGGAISMYKTTDVQILDNEFTRNALGILNQKDFFGVGPGGGAIGMSNSSEVVIRSNDFNENTAMHSGGGSGAGVVVGGQSHDVEIDHNEFFKNVSVRTVSASGVKPFAEAAAILIDVASRVNIHHNRMVNNSATTVEDTMGSVIYISGFVPGSDSLGSADITIDANHILGSGDKLAVDKVYDTGGIRVFATESCAITNNIIANGSYYGVLLTYMDNNDGQVSHASLVNNTLVNNKVLGVGLDANWSTELLTVTNNIVMSHTTGLLSDSFNEITVDHHLFFANSVNISGSITTTASVLGDPLFWNVGAMDYHILYNSPARDVGAGIPPAPLWDAGGHLRPYGPGVDIGAYEAMGFYLPFMAR